MSKNKSGNGWSEYQKLVLSKLESHDNNISDILKQVQTTNEHLSDFKVEVAKGIDAHKTSCKIAEEFPKVAMDIAGIKVSLNNIRKTETIIANNTKDIGDLKVNVGQLQVKSGLWGAVGGLISIVTVMLLMAIKNGENLLKMLTGK